MKSRRHTIYQVTDACIVHAETHGWNLTAKDNLGWYIWRQQEWWPAMESFIRAYPLEESVIEKWCKFDQLDVGIDAYNERVCRYLPRVPILKNYLVNYLAEERLFKVV